MSERQTVIIFIVAFAGLGMMMAGMLTDNRWEAFGAVAIVCADAVWAVKLTREQSRERR